MSKYEEIEAFVRTIQAGSFTAAAKQLRVAKSAVSRRVQELELRLDVQLINRTTRTLALTEAGEALFKSSVILLKDWAEAEDTASGRRTDFSGNLRITAPLSFGLRHLSPLLLKFKDMHPDINYQVDFNDRYVDLISEGMDLAIRVGHLADSSLIARKLAPIRMIACASSDYLERAGRPKTPADLKNMDELHYMNRDKSTWVFTSIDGVSETVVMPEAMRSSNGDFLMHAAIAGHGVVIQPSFIMNDAVRVGKLVKLLPDYSLPELGLYAVYPPTRHLSARVRALVDFLAQQCGDEPYWDQ